jgi:crotonobetainyl-CoA:carnitine CoA-transferase CaiB-like acyl-CoA transferase
VDEQDGLLAGVRVLDLAGGAAAGVGRVLADLGADVLKVEPEGGTADRGALPRLAGWSVPFELDNANKRTIELNDTDRAQFTELVASADIVIDGGRRGQCARFGVTSRALAQRFPQQVVLSITDFGEDGPRAAWQATDAVLYAMSTALARSGPASGQPVLPPAGIATATAAFQAAWNVLVAYFRKRRCGKGDFIDFSRFDAVLLALDPPFGSQGQAAAGRKQSSELWRGRPRNQSVYPIFPCRDGSVRICLLAARQWRGMFTWLGSPDELSDPVYDTIAGRYQAAAEINRRISELFSTCDRDEVVRLGQAHGVPVAAVLSPVEALAADHFRQIGALTDVPTGSGDTVVLPVGPLVVDGSRWGYRCAATPSTSSTWWDRSDEPVADSVDGPPLAGIRVLDLGVIVAGGELSRLFADMGADVIKIESPRYPDGLRQAPPGVAMTRTWALTHRNKSSLGLDLRTPDGAELFGRLVRDADLVLANFKPGTMASLGFSYSRLAELNPRMVLAESSAFGDVGPWSTRMGYGPLVRASTGVTEMWGSDGSHYDATTVFPDHVVGRVTAVAALAALVRSARSGRGAHIHVSQAEVAMQQLAPTFVTQAARAANIAIQESDSVDGVYPCSGDDEWCVISLRSEADRVTLGEVMGLDEVPDDTSLLHKVIANWTRTRTANAVADVLQARGVPAASMYRADDVLDDPQVRHRRVYTDMTHPLLGETIPAEKSLQQRPAPAAGEHTHEICRALLDLDDDEIERLLDVGVLFARVIAHP